MLTGKQKRFLRAEAHHLDPIFQVGKGGVNDAMIKQLSEALEARELIKVRILDNCEEDKHEVAEAVSNWYTCRACTINRFNSCFI